MPHENLWDYILEGPDCLCFTLSLLICHIILFRIIFSAYSPRVNRRPIRGSSSFTQPLVQEISIPPLDTHTHTEIWIAEQIPGLWYFLTNSAICCGTQESDPVCTNSSASAWYSTSQQFIAPPPPGYSSHPGPPALAPSPNLWPVGHFGIPGTAWFTWDSASERQSPGSPQSPSPWWFLSLASSHPATSPCPTPCASQTWVRWE